MIIDENIRFLIVRRMEQAEETLQDAQLLLSQDRYRSTVNRAYYAMFYAVLGLLQMTAERTSKHSGAIALFDRLFVKTGLVDRNYSKWFHEAFLIRQKSDYDEISEVTSEEARMVVEHSHEFVAQIKRLLEEQMGGAKGVTKTGSSG